MQNRMDSDPRPSAELQLLDLLGDELGRPHIAPAGRPRDEARDEIPMLAVLVLHLDGLSDWRARRGEAAARAVLHLVAARLATQVRVGDRTYRTADARQDADASGGCCLLHQVASLGAARAIAERLRLHLGSPWRIGPLSLSLRASIGLAVGPAAELVRLLDEARRALPGARLQPGGCLPFRGEAVGSGASAAAR